MLTVGLLRAGSGLSGRTLSRVIPSPERWGVRAFRVTICALPNGRDSHV
jgi:hypothetical protein